MFPGITFDELSQSQKDLVWSSVQNNKLEWVLSTETSVETGNSSISINASHGRLRFTIVEIPYLTMVKFGTVDENLTPSDLTDSEYWKELGLDMILPARIGLSPIPDKDRFYLPPDENCLKIN